MKINTISQTLLALGMLGFAGNALALEAWSGQEGSQIRDVIFNSKVYSNAWWVAATDCPQAAVQDASSSPWKFVRDATAAEITQYGNPTTCDAGGVTPVTHDAFSADKDYVTDNIVTWEKVNYKATGKIPAHSFTPGANNPWKLYTPVATWSATTTYKKGDVVKVNGQSYEALFYTTGDDPSVAGNQNPLANNGRPWKPLGATVEYTQAQLNAAPQLNTSTLYAVGTLVTYKGQPYVSQAQVKSVLPTDANLWVVYTDWTGTKDRVGTPKNPWPAHVYAPYVDFSLNDIPDLAKLATEQKINHFTMAFVVAKSAEQCIPTWGAAYGLQDYTQYSKIKALRDLGGDVMVSIGGAANYPMAAACKNDSDLQQVYHDIVENLNLNALDFDIEGTWVADHDSIQRRNRAVKAVQDQWKKEGRSVKIWYTLPILPTGLTAEGIYVLEDAHSKGVDLAGVNVMTMDYGNSICQSDGTEGQNIHGKCATSAIDNLFKQIKTIWPEKSDTEINAMMGTTPMIGYNDVLGEVFYKSDAKLVMEDATKRDLGMIGIWSMTRDKPGVSKQVSPEHSGMTEQQMPAYGYSAIFSPFTHSTTDLPGDVKAVFISVFNGEKRININLDSTKLSGSNAYNVDLDGRFIFSTNGTKYYYSSKYNYGAQTNLVAGTPYLAAGKVVTVKRTNPNPEVLAKLTVTEDMLQGNNPIVSAGEVKSITVKRINGQPNLAVAFDNKALGYKAPNGSAYVAKIMGAPKNGQYLFSCEVGVCFYSIANTVLDTSTNPTTETTTVSRGYNELTAGETIVIERTAPNPATVAKLLVTADMLK